jgi:hypothetical protein
MSDPYRPKGGFDLLSPGFLNDTPPDPASPGGIGKITLLDASPRDPAAWSDRSRDQDENDNTAYGSIRISH